MDNSQIYQTHISSDFKWFDFKLKELWRYKDLIVLFTQRSFALTYKQTILGPAWIFLTPILTSLIYTFVFGRIAGIGTDGVPMVLFYLASNSLWIYFSNSLTKNATTFTGNAGIFGKVYFPRLVIPVSNVLSSIIQFGIQMILVFVLLFYYIFKGQVHPNWWAWSLIPLVILHLGLLGLGFGILVSSVTTKYRDLTVLITFAVQLWMFLTPIVYPMSSLGEGGLRQVMLLNPVTPSVEIFRYALLGVGDIDLWASIISWVTTIIVSLFGIMVFNKVEKTFMDTV